MRFFDGDVLQLAAPERTQHRTRDDDGGAEQSDRVDLVRHDSAGPDGCGNVGPCQREKRTCADHRADSGRLPVLKSHGETCVADQHVGNAIAQHDVLLSAEVLDLCQRRERQHEYGTNHVQHQHQRWRGADREQLLLRENARRPTYSRQYDQHCAGRIVRRTPRELAKSCVKEKQETDN